MEVILGRLAIQAGIWLIRDPRGRKVLAALVALTLIVPLGFLVGFVALMSTAMSSTISIASDEQAALYSRCYSDPAIATQNAIRWADLNADQKANAAAIIGVTKAAVVVPGGADELTQQRAAIIAIATAMQESKLTNLTGGDRDSLGLFQQRPTMSWGTVEQISDPIYATTAFLYGAGTNRGLVDVPGWDSLMVTVVAQAVQNSGFPMAYAPWQALAQDVVNQTWATTPTTAVSPTLDRPDLADAATAVLHPIALRISAGNTGCELVPDGTTSLTTVWDGSTYAKPLPWGSPTPYPNGEIPVAAMCVVPWEPMQMGRCDAIDALIQLNVAWKLDHAGADIPITDSYRDRATQERTKARLGRLAATPGTSNHGLGMALDLSGFGTEKQYDAPGYLWMMAHGPAYGWVSPPWAQPGGSGPWEPWHWEFMGTTALTPTPAPTTSVAAGVSS